MELKLIVKKGRASKGEVVLDEFPVTVGRTRGAGLPIGHTLVSRHHCEIHCIDGAIVIRDCGSSNGTRINDELITEAVLRPGDRLTVGPLTFEAIYEPEVELPEAASTGASDSATRVAGFLASFAESQPASVAESLPADDADENTAYINRDDLEQATSPDDETSDGTDPKGASGFAWLYEDDSEDEDLPDFQEIDLDSGSDKKKGE
jgi:pSer/pThr/pTyr-binding forkhead associated (FHA) protein